jgi:hypothetical protein
MRGTWERLFSRKEEKEGRKKFGAWKCLDCGRDYLAAKRKKKGAKSLELRSVWIVGEII